MVMTREQLSGSIPNLKNPLVQTLHDLQRISGHKSFLLMSDSHIPGLSLPDQSQITNPFQGFQTFL